MRKVTLLLSLFCLVQSLTAQFVTIPDANFRAALIQRYPSCFNASQEMDTTCSAVVSERSLDFSRLQVVNLDGIQYFDSLRYLNCVANRLTSLPALPSGLQTLYCYRNQLTSLPALPSSLQYLYCDFNQLTSLPMLPSNLQLLSCFNNQLVNMPTLPMGLQGLDCDYNQLTGLPALPSGLQSLRCSHNQLTNLPILPIGLQALNCNNNEIASLPILPNSLIWLYCNSNRLTSLPALPNNLFELECDSNQLTSMPALPNTLQTFDCKFNQLTSLPALPNSLQIFNCGDNQLTSLPSLPSHLRELLCYGNELTSLPSLPRYLQLLSCPSNQLTYLPDLPTSLEELYCGGNQLTSLPALPSNLSRFHFENNPNLYCLPQLPSWIYGLRLIGTAITCLPNYTQYITQASTGLPLCTNPNQICQVNPMARGIVFNDANNNGVRDTLEYLVGGIPISVNPNSWTNVSDTTNGYIVKLDTLPVINTITVGNVPYRTFTPSSYSVTTTSLGLASGSYDFAMSTQANITDLVTRISTWLIRPGFQTSANVNVENIGTIDQTNASISLEIPNGLTVISTIPSNGVVTGNTVTWSGESIAIFERKSYSVSLQVPVTMPLGTSLTYTAIALPSGSDFTADNNYIQERVVVTGSYDPNDKLVNKDRLPNNYVAADEEMLYTIRFQNTGTDTAFTVLIRDTLDLQKLDFSTFRVTGASHALRTNVRDQGVVEFVFNNILLPDSFVNEPLSHGYVQFRIHPKANLPLGTQIKNRAFIYFDFNAPIITNFATTTVGLLSVSSAELGAGSLSLYPVPVAEQLTVNFNAVRSGEVRYRLLDLQGRLLQEQQLSVVEGENISTMDMGKLGAGMYLLQVVGEQGSVSSKIVKE